MTQTFMQAVEAYNTYLNNIKNRSAASQSRMKPFLQGMAFQPLAPLSSLVCNHPIYSRQDLTNEQKDAVVLASDWVRAERTLDDMLAVKNITPAEAQACKVIARNMVQHYESIYAAK